MTDTAHKLRRNTDPATSAEAAESIVPHLNDLQQFAVDCVRKTPGLTAAELTKAHVASGDVRVLNRRLGECEAAGRLRRGTPRPCSVSGRRAAVWYVVPPPSSETPSLFGPEE